MDTGSGVEYVKPDIEEYGSLETLTRQGTGDPDDGLTGSN